MGNSLPSGPNVVTLMQRGGGQDCDCGAVRFDAEGAKHDSRLIGMFGQEAVNYKIDSLVSTYQYWTICVWKFFLIVLLPPKLVFSAEKARLMHDIRIIHSELFVSKNHV